MAAAATSSASGMGRHRAEGHGYGPVLLASVLPVIAGCFNLIYGIAVTASDQHRLPRPGSQARLRLTLADPQT